jgi:hypothetical protein
MFEVALFPNLDPIFPTPFRSPSVYNAMMTDFIARFGEFRFIIISPLILVGLKLSELQVCIVPNNDIEKKQYVLRLLQYVF